MKRITEEAIAVLTCYPICNKQEMMLKIERDLFFVEDVEMKTTLKNLLNYLKGCTVRQYREVLLEKVMDSMNYHNE